MARACLSAIFLGPRLGHQRSGLGFLCSLREEGSGEGGAAPSPAFAVRRTETSGGAGNRIAGGEIERDETGANGMIEGESIVPLGTDGDRSIPPKDDSGTIRTAPRSLIAALTKASGDVRIIGDVTVARLAAKLLAHVLEIDEHKSR